MIAIPVRAEWNGMKRFSFLTISATAFEKRIQLLITKLQDCTII
jgi:hypothetical protein